MYTVTSSNYYPTDLDLAIAVKKAKTLYCEVTVESGMMTMSVTPDMDLDSARDMKCQVLEGVYHAAY